MAKWQRISREGHPEIRGIHGQGDRLDVAIPLSAPAPPEWARFVVARYTERPHFNEMGGVPPQVQGSRILIAPHDKELEDWIKSIDETIEDANDFYEKQVLPGKEAKEADERSREEDAKRRLDEAKRKAQNL